VLPHVNSLPFVDSLVIREMRPAFLRHTWLPSSPRVWLLLLPICILVVLLRGFPLFGHAYPSGPDYGHHIFYAELFLADGKLPSTIPYFQLGATNWVVLPGGSLIYAMLSALSGARPIDTVPITVVFGVIEVCGTFLLAWRVFRRLDSAAIAALIVALIPSSADMMSWSAYPNLIALSFIPFSFVSWLDYWEQPNWRRLLVAVIIICGNASIHHLSTMWLGLTLILFSLVQLLLQPRQSLRKLLWIGLAGGLVGLPILLKIKDITILTGALDVLARADRFEGTRTLWAHWAVYLTPVSLVFITAGLLALFLFKPVYRTHKVLIASYMIVGLIFAFGWIIGLQFYYARALFFLPLPIAIAAATLIGLWRDSLLRFIMIVCVFFSLGMDTLLRATLGANFYQVLTPDTVEAANWLVEASRPEDVVVVSGFMSFQMTRLLRRPTLVALTPELIGNPQELPYAADALAVLEGLYNIDEILDSQGIRYVMIRSSPPDVTDPARSRIVLNANPRLRIVFQNAEIIIYQVQSR
jgi:hypothetical protein